MGPKPYLCQEKKMRCDMTSREWIDLYAGTYTDQGSRGIYALRYNQVTGEAQAVEAMTVPHP